MAQLKSLGLIETVGLVAAVEAADAAVKSANVTLAGYELAKGGGMTTVKVEGEVGAVTAAVSAARSAAAKVGRVVSTRVIARPASCLEAMVRNADTVGAAAPEKKEAPEVAEEPPTAEDRPAADAPEAAEEPLMTEERPTTEAPETEEKKAEVIEEKSAPQPKAKKTPKKR